MNNDGSGCVGGILLALLLVVVVGIAVSMTGLPTWDGSLGWNTAATYERQLTERERIAEEGRTERERIAANAETSRTWAIALTVMVAAGSIGVVGVAWSRRPHKPAQPPAPVIALLPHYPGHVAELIDGEWSIVEPTSGYYYTATDAARLLTVQKN